MMAKLTESKITEKPTKAFGEKSIKKRRPKKDAVKVERSRMTH